MAQVTVILVHISCVAHIAILVLPVHFKFCSLSTFYSSLEYDQFMIIVTKNAVNAAVCCVICFMLYV